MYDDYDGRSFFHYREAKRMDTSLKMTLRNLYKLFFSAVKSATIHFDTSPKYSSMENVYIEYIYLILIILGLVMLAQRLKIAYPIVLVLGGLVLSFIDGFGAITIDPNLIFFIFLPPLLYEAAWATSWKEFWKWRRVITSFAFPIVIVTSFVVAIASNALIPGFTLALGFLLGGIISPPDAISASSIMRNVQVP